MSAWDFVTDFGDSAVTVPLALLTFGFLLTAAARRIAFAWAMAVGGCAAAIGGLKVVFATCGPLVPHVLSPSGHTAMSTIVYGALAVLVGERLPPRRRPLLAAAAGLAVVGIGLSRWMLRDHSLAEIIAGFGVGMIALLFFRARLGGDEPPPLPLKGLLLSAALLVAVMHGTRWMVEPAVHRLAWHIRVALPWCR
ncbi:MAG TPA: phosphatase PAP2 family protein [Stellaceae bacterium]|nr:phosphatase PAP2 family protein [Stellaceae bacterium]